MNVIGKMLVILNLLFALAVGAFMVIDFATRTNFKTSYDQLKSQMDVLKAGHDAAKIALANEALKGKKDRQDLEEARQKIADEQALTKANETVYAAKEEDLKTRLKDGDLSLQKSLAEQERLKTEVADREMTLKDRNSRIINLEAVAVRYRQEAISQESQRITLQERNEKMQEDLQNAVKKLARFEAGVASVSTGSTVVRSTNDPNPPPVQVRGKIEKVEGSDSGLVQISLGTDQGVNKHNTLEVFRRSPDPQYLGMIRIVEAYHNRSVGRRVPTFGISSRVPLREGDEVASDLKK